MEDKYNFPEKVINLFVLSSQDGIAAILSKVPLEDNYLKNVVKQIYQDLLHDCHVYHWIHGPWL